MTEALLIARWCLALVFVVAAVGKLAERSGLRATLTGFGLAGRLARVGALVLPLVELTIAALLVPSTTARAGAMAALGLLAVFCVVIGRAIARGERPGCNCFGPLHSSPVGARTLVRNLSLAAVAGAVAVAGPGEGVGAALAGVDRVALAGVLALVGVLVAQAWFSWQLFAQNGRLIARVEALEAAHDDTPLHYGGLQPGSQAPAFELTDLEGRPVSLEDLLGPSRPLVLVFSDPGCGACGRFMPTVGEIQRARRGQLEIAVITRGSAEQNITDLEGVRIAPVLLQREREVMEAYLADAVPAAVLIDPDGVIASPLAWGAEGIEELLSMAGAAPPEVVPSTGRPA